MNHILQTNSSFPLRLSESQGMFNFGEICQSSVANLPSSTRALFSDKAHYCCQSEFALYENFIINIVSKSLSVIYTQECSISCDAFHLILQVNIHVHMAARSGRRIKNLLLVYKEKKIKRKS